MMSLFYDPGEARTHDLHPVKVWKLGSYVYQLLLLRF
ncbi:hypothetical protein NT98_4282 [Bacillus cereus]|nr:hypothetical protein NT98_4282 [Bacillus cereus]AJI02851.1 hypothetical protein AQ16_1231 [Bacillus cereus G9241]